MADRKFARLYYDQFMEEFGDIYADDAALSAWIRMLVLAEKMWPIHPEVPRAVKQSALRKLIDADLIRVRGETYSVRGYDAERRQRAKASRIGAAARWSANGNAISNAISNANAVQVAMPSTSTSTRREQRFIKTSPPTPP